MNKSVNELIYSVIGSLNIVLLAFCHICDQANIEEYLLSTPRIISLNNAWILMEMLDLVILNYE